MTEFMEDAGTTLAPATSDDYDAYLDDVTTWIIRIGIIALLVLGTTGNGLVVLVLSVRKLSPHPTSVMLVLLALFDSMVLWTGHFRMLYLFGGFGDHDDFRLHSNTVCRLHTFLTYFSVSIATWMLVLVTSHRLVAVTWPLRARTLLTMRRTIMSVVFTVGVCFSVNIHLVGTVGLTPYPALKPGETITNETYMACHHPPATYHFLTFIWPKMDLSINSIVPFIVLLFCNGTIIYKVTAGNKLLSNDNKKDSKTSSNNMAMTIMLVSVNVIFLVTTAPFAIYNTDVFRRWIDEYSPLDNLLFTLFYIIQGINSASNFYIYCLSGRKFREELILTFTGSSNRRRQESVRNRSNRSVVSTNQTRSTVYVTNGHVKNGSSEKSGVVNEACDEPEIVTKL